MIHRDQEPQGSAAVSRQPAHTFAKLMQCRAFRALREGYWLERTLTPHVEAAGAADRDRLRVESYGAERERLVDERFIRWTPAIDVTTGHRLPTRDLTAKGEWLYPVHEALKREEKGPARRWLLKALQWQGACPPTVTTRVKRVKMWPTLEDSPRERDETVLEMVPCGCCSDSIAHFAMIDRTTPQIVFQAIVRATLRAQALIEAHVAQK